MHVFVWNKKLVLNTALTKQSTAEISIITWNWNTRFWKTPLHLNEIFLGNLLKIENVKWIMLIIVGRKKTFLMMPQQNDIVPQIWQINAQYLGNGFKKLQNTTRMRGNLNKFYIALPCNLFRSPLESKCHSKSVIWG